MEEKYFTVSKHKLTNHCPECYSSDGLELTFRQRFNESPFYKAVTRETKHDLYCNTCNTDIYPVKWTEDIEPVVAYHQRALKPKKPSVKLKNLSWIFILIAVILIIVLAVNYFMDTDVIP